MAPKRNWPQARLARVPPSQRSSTPMRFGSLVLVLALFLGAGTPPSKAADLADYAFAHRGPPRTGVGLMQSADLGNPEAQTYLGYLYYKGRGVPQDYAAAVYWLTRAAQQGEATAQFILGLLYDKGQGVEESFAKAYFWLNLSAAHSGPRERDFRMRVRDAVRNKLMGTEVVEAQQWASQWRPAPEQ